MNTIALRLKSTLMLALLAVACCLPMVAGLASVNSTVSADALCDAMRARFGPGYPCIAIPTNTFTPTAPAAPGTTLPGQTNQTGGPQAGSNIGPGPGEGNGTPIVPVPTPTAPSISSPGATQGGTGSGESSSPNNAAPASVAPFNPNKARIEASSYETNWKCAFHPAACLPDSVKKYVPDKVITLDHDQSQKLYTIAIAGGGTAGALSCAELGPAAALCGLGVTAGIVAMTSPPCDTCHYKIHLTPGGAWADTVNEIQGTPVPAPDTPTAPAGTATPTVQQPGPAITATPAPYSPPTDDIPPYKPLGTNPSPWKPPTLIPNYIKPDNPPKTVLV